MCAISSWRSGLVSAGRSWFTLFNNTSSMARPNKHPTTPKRFRAQGSEIPFGGELLRQQLSQHERQNPPVPVIIDFDRCIDAKLYGDRTLLPVFAFDLERYALPGFNCIR